MVVSKCSPVSGRIPINTCKNLFMTGEPNRFQLQVSRSDQTGMSSSPLVQVMAFINNKRSKRGTEFTLLGGFIFLIVFSLSLSCVRRKIVGSSFAGVGYERVHTDIYE